MHLSLAQENFEAELLEQSVRISHMAWKEYFCNIVYNMYSLGFSFKLFVLLSW